MVWPHRALVQRDILDLRGDPRADAELVDQAHHGESVRLLGEHGEWRYLQAEDQYFGWASSGDLGTLSVYGESHYVAVLLADVREAAEPLAEVLARLPVGTHVPRIRAT